MSAWKLASAFGERVVSDVLASPNAHTERSQRVCSAIRRLVAAHDERLVYLYNLTGSHKTDHERVDEFLDFLELLLDKTHDLSTSAVDRSGSTSSSSSAVARPTPADFAENEVVVDRRLQAIGLSARYDCVDQNERAVGARERAALSDGKSRWAGDEHLEQLRAPIVAPPFTVFRSKQLHCGVKLRGPAHQMHRLLRCNSADDDDDDDGLAQQTSRLFPIFVPTCQRAEVAHLNLAAEGAIGGEEPFMLIPVIRPDDVDAYARRWNGLVFAILPAHAIGVGAARDMILQVARELNSDSQRFSHFWMLDDSVGRFFHVDWRTNGRGVTVAHEPRMMLRAMLDAQRRAQDGRYAMIGFERVRGQRNDTLQTNSAEDRNVYKCILFSVKRTRRLTYNWAHRRCKEDVAFLDAVRQSGNHTLKIHDYRFSSCMFGTGGCRYEAGTEDDDAAIRDPIDRSDSSSATSSIIPPVTLHEATDNDDAAAAAGNPRLRLDADPYWTGLSERRVMFQKRAVNAVLDAFWRRRGLDRATIVWACGTGKTNVVISLLEALANGDVATVKRVIVFVPSLMLLRQTLLRFRTFYQNPFEFFCACSQRDIAEDGEDGEDIPLYLSEVAGSSHVSTDPAVIGDALARHAERDNGSAFILFSTYNSAPKVGECGESFCFGVFDEAHFTASRRETFYTFALHDANISIRKRLFMTATPVHYRVRTVDEAQAMRAGALHHRQDLARRLVFSMDDERWYGPVVDRLTFEEAARQRLICRWSIIVSVVTRADVAAVLGDGEVDQLNIRCDDGSSVDVDKNAVAIHLALRSALRQGVRARKIFSFHKSVAEARGFVTHQWDDAYAVPGFARCHINHTMSVAERSAELCRFRTAPLAICSNVQCLGTGIDEAQTDMVMLLNNRTSHTTLVQNVSRALRPAPGKRTGYVFTRVHIDYEKGESLESAVARSDMQAVWDVLQTMADADSGMAAHFDIDNAPLIVLDTRSGGGGGGGRAKRSARLDDASLRSLAAVVRARIVDPFVVPSPSSPSFVHVDVSQIAPSWLEKYACLQTYHATHAHSDVLRADNNALYEWVKEQRSTASAGALPMPQRTLLERLGFVWKPGTFGNMCARLERFRDRYGHCVVPATYRDQRLRAWAWRLVVFNTDRRRGTNRLSATEESRLRSLGFEWRRGAWRAHAVQRLYAGSLPNPFDDDARAHKRKRLFDGGTAGPLKK